jgi:general secretion pathway protein N
MRWKWFAVGLGAYAIGLLAFAPATLVDVALERASAGRMRLADAHGSIWSGAGRLELIDAGRRNRVAQDLAWHVLPWSLYRGYLVCEIGLDPAARRLPLTISLSGIELADADLTLPPALAGLIVSKLAPLGLTGDMLLHITHLYIGRGGIEGGATLQWRSVRSTLTRIAPLGDYELRLEARGTLIHASLRTLQGLLQLEGEGSWASGDAPVFAAVARTAPQFRQELAPLLGLIAVARDDNSFEFRLR